MALAGLQPFQSPTTIIAHPLAMVPNFGVLQPAAQSTVHLSFDLSKIAKANNNLMTRSAENFIRPLLPQLPIPFTDQFPVNLIASNSTFPGETCPSCSKTYKSKKDLQDHVIIHHERKFECERCTRTFVSEKRMRAHELKKHSVLAANFTKGTGGRKLFQCNQCDRTYETFYNFKEHLAKHKGKLFRCTICNKHLSGQSALSRHSKIHEKPHECMMCTSRFSSAYDLDCHFSYYHSTVKRFKCFHCDRVLYNYSGKLRHERLCLLKQSVIKKTPDSGVAAVQKMLTYREESVRTVTECKMLMDTEKCELIQNPTVLKAISAVKFATCEIASVPENHCNPASKPQRRRTFHICDIMHDVPGFSQ